MIPAAAICLMTAIAWDRNIASVSPIPVLILHGTAADHVIPRQDSEKLSRPEPKQKSSFLTAIH